MSKEKAITNLSKHTDAALDELGGTVVKCLTGNPFFTFGGSELTTLATNETRYHNSLAALATGGTAAVIEKNAARSDLLTALNVVAIQVNLQANSDLTKLLSSGLPLVKHKTYHAQPIPGNLYVENGVGSSLYVSVDVSPVGDNGTIFAYTPVSNTANDPNLWTLIPSNGHSAVIKGLTPGVEYKITAAYKGNDSDDLVWAAPISKFAGN